MDEEKGGRARGSSHNAELPMDTSTLIVAPHRQLMVELATHHRWRYGAELGLGSGHLLDRLLGDVPELFVIGVDHFVRDDRRQKVRAIAKKFQGRCIVHECTTAKAANLVQDESLDFVFIDAGHKYGCVRSDIRLWWAKVKIGGWFGGHDYAPYHSGVIRAVDERFGRTVNLHPHSVWSVVKS